MTPLAPQVSPVGAWAREGMKMNDNGKASTAKEVTSLADAIFNKCSAIQGAHASDVDRLFGELGRLIERADNMPASRSVAANGLLAKAKTKAHETAQRACV